MYLRDTEKWPQHFGFPRDDGHPMKEMFILIDMKLTLRYNLKSGIIYESW